MQDAGCWMNVDSGWPSSLRSGLSAARLPRLVQRARVGALHSSLARAYLRPATRRVTLALPVSRVAEHCAHQHQCAGRLARHPYHGHAHGHVHVHANMRRSECWRRLGRSWTTEDERSAKHADACMDRTPAYQVNPGRRSSRARLVGWRLPGCAPCCCSGCCCSWGCRGGGSRCHRHSRCCSDCGTNSVGDGSWLRRPLLQFHRLVAGCAWPGVPGCCTSPSSSPLRVTRDHSMDIGSSSSGSTSTGSTCIRCTDIDHVGCAR
jgi:hypothetical protein